MTTWSPGFKVVTSGPVCFDDAGPFVTTDHRTQERHVAGQEVLIRVAQAGGDETDEHLVVPGWVQLDRSDLPDAARFPQHSGFGLQSSPPWPRGEH